MLSDAQCKAAKPRARQYVLTDADGLELLVTPAGAKVWRFRYRFGDQRRRITLGYYPTMRLAAARGAAAKHRNALWSGEDPATVGPHPDGGGSLHRISTPSTIDAVIDSYIAEHQPAWRPKTASTYLAAIKTFREWARASGLRFARDITPSALASFRAHAIERPQRSRHAKATNADQPRTRNAVNSELRAIKTMLQALRKAGRLPAITASDHVTDNLGALKVKRTRPDPLLPAQLRTLLDACRRHDAAGHAPAPIGPLVALVLLTGMRVGEALRLTWTDVDLDAMTIRVDAYKTNERRVNLRVCPVVVQLLGTLARGRKASPHDRVFAHTKKSARTARLRLIADYDAPAFLYSTRHSRADAGDDNGRGASRSVPTLRSTCGSYLTCAPGIFGAASAAMSALQLGHSVKVAQDHYVGALWSIPADATTVEAAMGIEAEVTAIVAPARRLRVV